jgi:hypothetical protein
MPTSAVKSARSVTWTSSIDASHAPNSSVPRDLGIQALPPPSIAILEWAPDAPHPYLLPHFTDTKWCGGWLCPSYSQVLHTQNANISASIYNGSDFWNTSVAAGSYSVFFKFAYNGSYEATTTDPQLSILVFDTALLIQPSDLELALNCSIIPINLFPARQRTRLSIEQLIVDDAIGAIEYPHTACDKFRRYNSYAVSVLPYGSAAGTLPDQCDVSVTENTSEYCINDVSIVFTTMRTTTLTSGRPKSWKEMLTDEGGIVGGIQFATWFFTIFTI